jgi:ribonuclease III
MSRRAAAVADLERRIGHNFADRALLERALTHASVGEGAHKAADNERLEFLGDRVLNLLAAERLMKEAPEAREGDLSRRLARLVNGEACAEVARRIGLPNALRLSASATKIGARDSTGVLGDACEALIAALYLDGGLPAARGFFQREFAGLDVSRAKDPKTELQEWAQGRGLPLPHYEVVARQGPDHAPLFTVSVSAPGVRAGTGEGRSRQEAEKAAAAALLASLKEDA